MSAVDIAVGLIKEHEGFSATPYLCPAGYPTIGYGRNLEAYPLSELEEKLAEGGVSKELAHTWLKQVVNSLALELSKMPLWQTLNPTRQAVILDLAYNVGLAGFYRFKRMIGALTQGDYERASEEMIDSKWYRQTGRRAEKLARLMKSGVLR